jgi:hypothetical protein
MDEPRHDGFWELTMVTLTVRFGFTVMQIWLDTAGLPVAQEKLESNWQTMQSPVTGV